MRARQRIPKRAAAAALLAALAAAGCSSGTGGESTAGAATPSELSASEVLAEPVARAGSDQFCTELTTQDALVGLADALAGDPARITEAVLAAAEELDSLQLPGSLDSALITTTVDSLRAWASDPADEVTMNSMSDSLEALGEEVQELCAFPVG